LERVVSSRSKTLSARDATVLVRFLSLEPIMAQPGQSCEMLKGLVGTQARCSVTRVSISQPIHRGLRCVGYSVQSEKRKDSLYLHEEQYDAVASLWLKAGWLCWLGKHVAGVPSTYLPHVCPCWGSSLFLSAFAPWRRPLWIKPGQRKYR
jgi:hypothetical protein